MPRMPSGRSSCSTSSSDICQEPLPDGEAVARLLLWVSSEARARDDRHRRRRARRVCADAGAAPSPRGPVSAARPRRARGRRRGGRAARGGPGAAPSRHCQTAHRAAHRRSRPCSHHAHARDRRRPVVHSDRRPVPAQLAVVAPRRRASRAGRAAAARPHGGGRRRARRSASRRPRRGAGRAGVPARRRLASRGRRATARRVAAPRPPAGGARGVRAGVRGLPARVVGGRRRAPGQLRARARDLRHAPVAAGTRAMDARRASRGPRRRLRSARPRGCGRRGGQPGDRGARERPTKRSARWPPTP